MSAYHGEREKEARRLRLEERRGCLAVMLEEERTCLEEELRGLQPDRRSLLAQLVQKTDALRSAREDRRRKVAHSNVISISRALVSRWLCLSQYRTLQARR
jgi:trichoplein keratin filament-binding protein